MVRPAVSVVIPTHDRAELIARALESVRAQTFDDFEVLIVDDASTDDPESVVKALGDVRFRYMVNARAQGSSGARNTGILASNADLVCFLDDDDEWDPGFLMASVAKHRERPEAGFSWCGFRRIANGKIVEEVFWKPDETQREAAYLAFLHERRLGIGCGVMVKRKWFDRVGVLNESLNEGADGEFLTRLFRDAPFTVIDGQYIAYHVRQGAARLSNRPDSQRFLAIQATIREHGDTLERHPHEFAMMHAMLAIQHYLRNERRLARTALVTAIRRSPRSVRPWKVAAYYELRRNS